MEFENVAESRIREAMDQGLFENLVGAGQPLNGLEHDALAGENWMGFHLLKNGGLLPERLELAREIDLEYAALDRLDRRHAAVVEAARSTGDWVGFAGALRSARQAYERHARAIRARQDRYNIGAGSIAAERPGIWVEHHLARLDARVTAAGGPTTS